MGMRIGFGYDTHRLVAGRDLVIGGVRIKFGKGLDGHSDADVLLHAFTDALLGAANLRDIGSHFPNDNPLYKNLDSSVFLIKAMELLAEKKYTLVNADCTIVAEAPKMMPFIPEMEKNISRLCGVETGLVSIKAKTGERMDAIGRGEGIAAYAVVLIESAGNQVIFSNRLL